MPLNIFKNPINKKRFQRFKQSKIAFASLCIIVLIYLISLCAETICNSSPLYIKFNGNSYFPAFFFYPEDTFLKTGNKTRPDYKNINNMPVFKDNPDNFMIFPFFKTGPYESIDPKILEISENVEVIFSKIIKIGTVNIYKDFSIARSNSFELFINNSIKTEKNSIDQYFILTNQLKEAISKRFSNLDDSSASFLINDINKRQVVVSLSKYKKREKPPSTVRLKFSEKDGKQEKSLKITFNKNLKFNSKYQKIWKNIPIKDKKLILNMVESRFKKPVDPVQIIIDTKLYKVSFVKQDIRFPFKPIKGHLMGIDSAGRDVFARILYGLRASLTFGLMLSLCSMLIGIVTGSIQGYYGGWIDIGIQRFIEIWSALPFLYVMILMGSIYGRSFILLLICYGIFNWIGISWYVRAEFLRIRGQAFVEAAKCMGIPAYKIIFKHILPNAIVPVITFFPFSLVGAIGSLAALDYLGFGLPPPSPSLGELLLQAQQYKWAWWLIVYPSGALFIIMLLGVFIGEGIRNAYDPKKYTKLR